MTEAIKRGAGSLRTLLSDWRDRFDANAEDATREVLNFLLQVRALALLDSALGARRSSRTLLYVLLLLQACGGEGQCVPTTEALEKLDMSDLVRSRVILSSTAAVLACLNAHLLSVAG